FGHARERHERPVPTMEGGFAVASFVCGLAVYGPRFWREGVFRLEPSEPVPFLECPLTLEHAYGGKQLWDGIEVPYTANPQGKGYYLDEGAARYQPLPNLEDPRAPIRKWNDQPVPVGVGLCPRSFGPRVQRSVEIDAAGAIRRIAPSFFNDAFPDCVAPRVEPGTPAEVWGVHP